MWAVSMSDGGGFKNWRQGAHAHGHEAVIKFLEEKMAVTAQPDPINQRYRELQEALSSLPFGFADKSEMRPASASRKALE